jgi:hypothetical protein
MNVGEVCSSLENLKVNVRRQRLESAAENILQHRDRILLHKLLVP